jgi:hypothetical protein
MTTADRRIRGRRVRCDRGLIRCCGRAMLSVTSPASTKPPATARKRSPRGGRRLTAMSANRSSRSPAASATDSPHYNPRPRGRRASWLVQVSAPLDLLSRSLFEVVSPRLRLAPGRVDGRSLCCAYSR